LERARRADWTSALLCYFQGVIIQDATGWFAQRKNAGMLNYQDSGIFQESFILQ
jgi:hypothetical protein